MGTSEDQPTTNVWAVRVSVTVSRRPWAATPAPDRLIAHLRSSNAPTEGVSNAGAKTLPWFPSADVRASLG